MRSLRRYVGRRMVIQIGEHTLDGTVHDAHRDVVILRNTTLVQPNATVPLDGEVAVPSTGIGWAQVVI